MTVEKLIDVMKRKKYVVFVNDTKNYNLNIVGVRSKNRQAGKFDDKLYIFWKYKGQWTIRCFPITTDPGRYYLNNPLSPTGTAILKPGQYRGIWAIGLHRGKYKALVQVKPVTVIRDYNKDNILDFDSKREETGLFGINLHRALREAITVDVGKFSAGCQVTANSKDFDEIMDLAEKAAAIYGNSFSYTLLEESDFDDMEN